METTTYESPFPSGLYEPNIQAERRLDSPLTVATARSFNRHDVEIRRIEEVLGLVPPHVSGQPYPSGGLIETVYNNFENVQNIITGSGIYGDMVPFHSTPSDPNYQFVQWFMEWMGIWTDLSASGTPSIVETMKVLWNNKYDLEVLFDPVFLYPADLMYRGTGSPTDYYFEYEATGLEGPIFCGYLDANPKKPVGGGCNLNVRPWSIYDVYDETGGGFLQGVQTLVAGHTIRFYTYPTNGDASIGTPSLVSEKHMLGLFGNTPYTWLYQPSGSLLALPSGSYLAPPVAVPPEPPPPVGHGVPGAAPGGPEDSGPGPDDPSIWDVPVPLEMVEADKLIIRPPLMVLTDQLGNKAIGSAEVKAYPPIPYSDPTKLVQVGAHTIYGVRTDLDGATAVIPLQAKCWITIGVTIANGSPVTTITMDDPKGFAKKMPFNGGVAQAIPADIVTDLPQYQLGPGETMQVAIMELYSDEPGTVYVVFSDEGFSAPASWCTGFWSAITGTK